ncbi:MAG: glycosyltransferase family 39 protein [Acidobacteria bacterium]|nr:glycosyltransferase family 39 protein [Acidobacteriota bacterium]MBI3424123.1 glycosyltransferase family 39 protein [Acidobacteriota bacterium]
MRPRYTLALLLLFLFLIFAATSFKPALLDDADATHAEAAKEMLERSDGVTLYVNGVRYLEKAPLLYWAVAASFKVFGFNAFAVRFSTVIAIVLLALSLYHFGRWAYSDRAGLYAAAAIGTCLGMYLFTRAMIPEALLTLWFTLAHYCFLRGFFGEGQAKRWYYGVYASVGVALVTKGLIGVVFVAGPIGLFLLLTRSLTEIKNMRLPSGTFLALVIAAPWHLLAGWRNPHFFWFYFINEQFYRFLGKRYPHDYNKVPFTFYWLMHLAWLFPWSVATPLLAMQRPSLVRQANRSRLINLYLFLWAGVILLFFNFSTSQEYYTFPCYAPLALLLGAAFANAETNAKAQRYLIWSQGVLAALALCVAALLLTLVWQARHVQPTGELANWLNQAPADATQYTLSLGHFFDLTTHAFAILRVSALGAALVFALGFPSAFLLRRRQQHGRAAVTMVAAMGALFLCANLAQQKFEPVLSSRSLADAIRQRWEPEAKIVFNGEYETGSSLAFYTRQQVSLLDGKVNGMWFGAQYPDCPPVFLEQADLRRLWQGEARIFLFTEESKQEKARRVLDGLPLYLLAKRGGKSVWMNCP